MRTSPPPEVKPSSLYWLLKIVYFKSQLRHSLEVHPLLGKILDPPLIMLMVQWNLDVKKYQGSGEICSLYPEGVT